MMMWIFEEFRYWVPPEEMVVALVFSFFPWRAGNTGRRLQMFLPSLSAALLGVPDNRFQRAFPGSCCCSRFLSLEAGLQDTSTPTKNPIGIWAG